MHTSPFSYSVCTHFVGILRARVLPEISTQDLPKTQLHAMQESPSTRSKLMELQRRLRVRPQRLSLIILVAKLGILAEMEEACY